MITTITIIYKILLLSWLINQLPIIWTNIKENLNFFKLIKMIIGCMKCSAFWIGLIITQDLYISITASYVAWLFDKYLNKQDIQL